MPHIIKTIRVRKADYDRLFKKLVTESKSKGYTDLHNFLTNWCNGMRRSYSDPNKGSYNIDTEPWLSACLSSYVNKTITPIVDEKTIIEQARSLGVKVRYNNIELMNLRDYY